MRNKLAQISFVRVGALALIVAAATMVGSRAAKAPKVQASSDCSTQNFTGEINLEDRIAKFEGQEISIDKALLATSRVNPNVLGESNSSRWIEVDLSEQKLKAWDGSTLFLETPVSTGLPHTPTPQGEFRIWVKLRATKMEGGQGRYYYYLPNVPYVMYFSNSAVPSYKGYGLHGAYWHNAFGTQRSHGCVNLPIPVAERLYHWVSPVLPTGKGTVYSDAGNEGTRIVIHQ